MVLLLLANQCIAYYTTPTNISRHFSTDHHCKGGTTIFTRVYFLAITICFNSWVLLKPFLLKEQCAPGDKYYTTFFILLCIIVFTTYGPCKCAMGLRCNNLAGVLHGSKIISFTLSLLKQDRIQQWYIPDNKIVCIKKSWERLV